MKTKILERRKEGGEDSWAGKRELGDERKASAGDPFETNMWQRRNDVYGERDFATNAL